MTNPTPHGQVPEALIDLIAAYADTRHRCGGIYNAKTEAARKAVIEALSGVQALSAAPVGFVPVAAFDRLHAHAESLAARLLAASPTPTAEQQAAPKAAPGDAIDEAMRERDDAEDFIDALLDEVLGHERPEWSNLYGRADALNDVQERMTSLHKPAVDKAWGQFQSAMAAPQQEPAPLSDDTKRLDWLDRNIFSREMSEWDAKYGHGPDYNMWVIFSPKGAQGSARNIIDAALAAQGGESHDN